MTSESKLFDEARAIFCDVLQREPDNPDGHHHPGLISMDDGKLDQAERRFRDAIKACELGRRSEAVFLLEELLRTDERDGLGRRYLLAKECHRQGKLARAMRMYKEQMENPGSRFRRDVPSSVCLYLVGTLFKLPKLQRKTRES